MLYGAFGFESSAGVDDRTLAVEVTSAVGGGSAVRADAQAVWVLARPAWERVPSDARSVTITATRGPGVSSTPVTLTAPVKLRAIARLLDGLPVFQPGTYACPADDGVGLELSFRAAANPQPVARVDADTTGCGGVSFSVGNRAGPVLYGGYELANLLAHLGGMALCTASDLRASADEPGRAGPTAAAGRQTLLTFRNTSSSICSAVGSPRLTSAAGAHLRERATHARYAAYLTIIPPGESAIVFVNWARSCPSDRVTSLRVKLDRIALPFVIPVGSATHPLDPCGGGVTVSALSGPF